MYQSNFLTMIVMAIVQHVPPHWILGYSWQELAAIVTIVIAISGAIAWIVNLAIVKPLQTAMNTLSKKIDGIGGNADIVHKDQDRRLDGHDVHLAQHDEELKTLFDWKNHGGSHE